MVSSQLDWRKLTEDVDVLEITQEKIDWCLGNRIKETKGLVAFGNCASGGVLEITPARLVDR